MADTASGFCSGIILDEFAVENVPSKAYYIPNAISETAEQDLLNHVYGAPKPKWTQLSGRRLQNWGGVPHPKGMIPEQLPSWLSGYADKLGTLSVFEGKVPNHVLVNEYEPGQGIMPHEDGPLFFPIVSTINLGSHTLLDFYYHLKSTSQEQVAYGTQKTCSPESGKDTSGSNSLEDRHFMSLLLEPRSLLLLCENLYTDFLHGIAERSVDEVTSKIANLNFCESQLGDLLDRKTRVSLTIRHVPKILKVKLKLGIGR